MWRGKLAIVWLFVILLSLPAMAAIPAQANDRRPYEHVPCQFKIPQNAVIECGYLTVPEDRTKQNSRTIRIAVAVFKAAAKRPKPDPIVFLMGGPGGYALKSLPRIYSAFHSYLTDRDFILFDQRGVGYSEPALECPEQQQLELDTLAINENTPALRQLSNDALQACHDRLKKAGIDLRAYSTAANAADVEDLRIALDYPAWNLFGISYGTRLALAVMRDYPKGVRSATLDSTYPPQLIAGRSGNINPFDTLFGGCNKNPGCKATYPNLSAVYTQLVVDLAKKPVVVSFVYPTTGKQVEILLNGARIQQALYRAMYSTSLIPYLPKIIFDTRQGKYSDMARLVLDTRITNEQTISRGMNYSVTCSDNASSSSLCTLWGVTADRVTAEPVTSTLPTLILSGEYDPVTPPFFNQTAAQTLKNSFLFQFPGTGHGVTVSCQCGIIIMQAFIGNPMHKPDGNCIAKLHEPDFALRTF